jgi:RecB family exonuclease
MPTLSHSQIETWQACPLRWKLQKDRVPETPQPALLLGRVVHTAIEQDNRQRAAGDPGLGSVDLQAAGRRALEEELVRYDPEGVLVRHLPHLIQQAEAMLAAYHRQIAGRYAPVLIEASFRIPLTNQAGSEFTGRIDALVTDADGARQIVDYKTAKRRWQIGAEREKLQATAYLWAAAQSEWGEVQGVIFIPLSATPTTGGYATWAEARPTERSKEQVASYQALVGNVIDEMTTSAKSGQYPAKPGWQCEWCPVARACPARRLTFT